MAAWFKKQWEGTLYVYYRENYPNLLIYQTTKTVFNNLKPTYLQPLKEKNVEISIIARYGLAMEFRNYLYDKTAKKYSILCYDIESVKNLLYTEKQKEEEEKDKEKTKVQILKKRYENKLAANQEKKNIFNSNLELGNDYFKQGLFDIALDHYESAKKNLEFSDEKSRQDLELRIKNSQKKLQEQNIQVLKNKAEELFTQQKYEESLQTYKSISGLNQDDPNIKERIACIQKILQIRQSGNTNQIYRKINPEGYSRFNDLNIRALNFMMRKSGDFGNLNYTFNIKFDKKGTNLSSFKVNSISDEKLMFNLTDITTNSIPASQLFIPCIDQVQSIASIDTLTYNLKWGSTIIRAAVKNDIIYSGSINNKVRDTLNAFINQFSSKNGIYTFKTTNKILNDQLYQDVWLTSYKTNSINASVFIPGFATYNSSGGKRGKGTTITFLLSTAFAIGSKLYSDHQFDQYKNSSSQKRDNYYNKANVANKCFIISGGFAVGIYLYDLSSLVVRSRGIKNNRTLKAELKNGPVSVLENSFNP
jgi:tetratricopeptide (TPR) repeat protein